MAKGQKVKADVSNESSPFPLPQDLILNPFTDPGILALEKPDYIWRPCQSAKILGFSASEHPEVSEKIDAFIARTQRHRVFAQPVEFNTFPVLMDDVSVQKSYLTAKGKSPISGSAGIRLLNRYCFEGSSPGFDAEAALMAFFNTPSGPEVAFPQLTKPLSIDTAFVIEARNTFNYFHFLTETLGQLCLVEEAGVHGPIYIHYPNPDEKTGAFCRAYIDALFPELADRVVFQRAPAKHSCAVTPYNFLASFYFLPEAERAGIDGLAPSDFYWKGPRATRVSHAVLKQNSVDSILFKLRDRALRAIEGKDFSHLPRRFWVSREDEKSRSRPMRGEAELVELLGLFGFETVMFERLSPLEQIAIMANAEVMISYHGAGFANMLFASPKSCVIEVGTLQTAVWRWGDFWRLAHVSQCRYVSFFADFNKADPLAEPSFNEESIVPVHLSTKGRAQVMSFLVSLLGHHPVLQRLEDLRCVVGQMVSLGADDRAVELLTKNETLAKSDADLCLLRADCHRRQFEHNAEFLALLDAWAADGSRWQTLVRMIWYGRRANSTKIVDWALGLLGADFPDRHMAFIKSAEWVRKRR
jgi:hypothetical protein